MASSFLRINLIARRALRTLPYSRPQTARPLKTASLALTALTTSSLFAFYLHNEHFRQRASLSSCDDNGDFQVHAALEVKEELEKVRLAQLVHDLHLLATQKGSGMRRYVTMFRHKGSSNVSPVRLQCGTIEDDKDKGKLSLKFPKDLLSKTLDREVCESLIHAIKAGGILSLSSFTDLLKASQSTLLKEKTVLDLTSHDDVFVVGDLHGDLASLSTVLRIIGDLKEGTREEKKTVVFDGDFVDRGTESLPVLVMLLLLKLTYPNQVFLLRGNHEDSLIASVYGFQDEVRRAYGEDEALWELITHTFASLPVAATTDNALIVHGGIPSADFCMEQLEKVTAEQRAQVLTTALPQPPEQDNDIPNLLQNLLWSDPDAKLGPDVKQNPRGIGVRFGTEIALDVLKRHDKQYLIRGHEVMSNGMGVLDCSSSISSSSSSSSSRHQVLTIFSSASYPAGRGGNLGAILRLRPRGPDDATSPQQQQHGYTAITFARDNEVSHNSQGVERIRSLIAANQERLATAFQAAQNWLGYVTVEQWCTILGQELELPEMPWKVLQPRLVARDSSMTIMGSTMIGWKAFLEEHSLKAALSSSKGGVNGSDISAVANHHHVAALHANHQMLLTVFKFLDIDKSGGISLEKFRRGVGLLNRHLPQDRQLKDPDHLFAVLDKDRSGQIDFTDFEQIFEVM